MNWVIGLVGLLVGIWIANLLRRWLPGAPGRRWRYLQPYRPGAGTPRAGAK